jgi:hypothetical protein
MEVSYTVTMEEYVNFNRFMARKFGTGLSSHLASWVFVALFSAAVAVALYGLGKDYEDWAFATAVAGFVCTMAYPIVSRKSMNRQIRDLVRKTTTEREFGTRTAIFSDKSLIVVSEMGRVELKWEAMDRVEEVRDTTYLFITKASAIILPRRGFDRDEDYVRARDFAFRKFGERAIS